MNERLAYSIPEVAQMLGVPESTVRGWENSGLLRVTRIAVQGKRGRALVKREDLDALLSGERVR